MQYESPSLNMMVADIKNIVSNGRATKDSPQVSDENIKFWILSKREKFLRQKLYKGNNINEFVQSLGCVGVSPVDKSTCCEYEIGCTFLRSDLPLPYFIGNPTRIASTDTTGKNWQLMKYEQVPLEIYAPSFSKKLPKAYFKDFDGYLYIYYDPIISPQSKYLTTINVQGILVDPQEASEFNHCGTGDSCYSDSTSFPISLSLWNDIKQDILKSELNIVLGTQEDTTNNNKADNVQAGQKGK
jgi:hypothetical protein